MTLPKHARPRWRYLAVEVRSVPDAVLTRGVVQAAIQNAVRTLLGDVGDAKTELRVLHFAFERGRGDAVIRTHRDTVDEARAALATLTTIDEHEIGLRVLGISGTVRACEEKYLGHDTESFAENTVVFEGEERPAVSRDMDIDVRVDDAFIGATRLDLE